VNQGRCAGCQETGELKAVEWHVLSCPDWARLYRDDPLSALPPGAEFERWRRDERDGERAEDLSARVADTVARRQVMADRFTRRDFLEG
jgi:hypothetical protein